MDFLLNCPVSIEQVFCFFPYNRGLLSKLFQCRINITGFSIGGSDLLEGITKTMLITYGRQLVDLVEPISAIAVRWISFRRDQQTDRIIIKQRLYIQLKQ